MYVAGQLECNAFVDAVHLQLFVDLDDETERELWRASVHAACIKSVHAVEMIRQEMTLLKMKAQKESGDDHMPDIPQGWPHYILAMHGRGKTDLAVDNYNVRKMQIQQLSMTSAEMI